MTAGNAEYGISNLEYDILMTLSNLLQAEEALNKYEHDATNAGDQQCGQLFHSLRDSNRHFAQQLRDALATQMQSGS